MQVEEDNHRLHEQHQHEEAARFRREQHQRETQAARSEALSKMHGSWHSHPVIEAADEELHEAGVTHQDVGEVPRVHFQLNHYSRPPDQMAAAGQLQAPEFPSFEVLNKAEPENLLAAKISREAAMSYEHIRDSVVERTWRS